MYLDLKTSLMLRLVVGALACFFIAAGLALFGTYRDVRQVNARVAEMLVRRLQIQLSHIESGIDATTRFPDFDLVSEHLQSAGQCVQYVGPDGSIVRSSCIGFNRDIGTPPAWFGAISSWIPAPQADVVRPISHRDKPYGSVVVTTERAAVFAAIWKEVSGMLGLTALVIGAICILQYRAISEVLHPTKDILAGLAALFRPRPPQRCAKPQSGFHAGAIRPPSSPPRDCERPLAALAHSNLSCRPRRRHSQRPRRSVELRSGKLCREHRGGSQRTAVARSNESGRPPINGDGLLLPDRPGLELCFFRPISRQLVT
jgi:hypothetical protein